MLKYCNWKINLNSPSDFVDLIYENLFFKYRNNNLIREKIKEYKDISITLLEYSICEYQIFSKYNQIVVCLSSCYITINQNKEKEQNECIVNNIDIEIKHELKKFLDQTISNLNLDKILIDSCISLILERLFKNDEENSEKEEKQIILDINSQLEISNIESNDSFYETVNTYIIDKSFEDVNSKNGDTNLIIKLSPISFEENISLNKEIYNNINKIKVFKDKKGNNNKFCDEELLFLNRKRSESKIKS